MDCITLGVTELDTTEQLSLHFNRLVFPSPPFEKLGKLQKIIFLKTRAVEAMGLRLNASISDPKRS